MMMKKIFYGLVIASVVIAGCVKSSNKCSYTDSTVIPPPSEIQALKDSLDSNHITATQNAAGFFYTINQQGSGAFIINLCSNVTVTYKGSFFNGKIFDSTVAGNAATFQLGQVIVGWQKGVPLISKGGDITLYIPPSLAYGPNPYSSGNTTIPGSSYLVFKIHVIDIQ